MTRNIALCMILALVITGCKPPSHMSPIQTHAIRLLPGQDLKQSIQQLVNDKHIEAGWVSACAGSLTRYHIRFANQPNATADSGHFEIVSLSGTVSVNGSHLHISISDSTGRTIGGHLMEGCIVYTTAEIVLLSNDSLVFKREKDGTTPWEELSIQPKK